jgi:hypothetical protein
MLIYRSFLENILQFDFAELRFVINTVLTLDISPSVPLGCFGQPLLAVCPSVSPSLLVGQTWDGYNMGRMPFTLCNPFYLGYEGTDSYY